MGTVLRILAYTFVFFSMLGIGLKVTRGDIINNLKDKALMGKALLANFIIVPVIAYALLRIFQLERADEMAMILLALAPGGISALQFTTKAKDPDSLGFSASLMFLLSLLSIIVTPLLIFILVKTKYEIHIPFGEFILLSLVFILLPLLIGLYLSEKKTHIAEKLAKPMALIGTLSFFAIIIYTFSTLKFAKSMIEGKTLLVILLFLGLGMLTGWLLGGPAQEKRRILASSTAMRNYALCILIVQATAPGLGLEFPLAAFASYMVPPNFLLLLSYNLYMKRKAKKLAQKTA